MSKNTIKYEGELNLNGFIIPCYVLEDGTRVISGRGMQEAIKLLPNTGKSSEQVTGSRMAEFISTKWFKSLITNREDLEVFESIICFKGAQKISGYRATALADFCDIILHARQEGLLNTERQKIVAEQCEILIRGFARVGIIALVDEATGYQYERENDELQKILSAYISKELLPWQKRFPDEFYKEIFRLNGWQYTVNGIVKNNRPGIIGTWTLQLIYNLLPNGVKEALEKATPKSIQGNKTARMHQSLTPAIGNPHLEKQLVSVITLMNVSSNWKDFIKLFQKKYAQTMMDEGISLKKIKVADPELADSTQPNLFSEYKESGTQPPKKISSGDTAFDSKINKAIKKGKPKE